MENNWKDLKWYEPLSDNDQQQDSASQKGVEISLSSITQKALSAESVNLEQYIADAYLWIDEVSALLKMSKRKDLAWSSLRSVLKALRDRMIPEEVSHLSAQLPVLIRGVYYEGYHYSRKPEKMNAGEFLNRISQYLGPAPKVEPQKAFKAVLHVLHGHISKGELEDIYATMPTDIKTLWDESMKTFTV